MVTDPNIPNTCRTGATPDGRYVRVIYEHHDREDIELLIPASQYRHFVKILQIQTDQSPSQQTRSFLSSGENLSVDGFELKPSARGALVLKAFARIADADGERGLTIPVPVSAENAARLKDTLDQRRSSELPD